MPVVDLRTAARPRNRPTLSDSPCVLILILILAATVGCGPRGGRGDEPDRDPPVIAVGQPWPEAVAVARAGYELEDASQLAMAGTPEGFYVNLPGGRGLIVYRDGRRDAVESMQWVENWPGPKRLRVYHAVRSFDVPPAEAPTP